MAEIIKNISIPAKDLIKSVTMNVTVTGHNELKIRMFIGKWMIRLGARIMGAGIIINDVEGR